MSIDERLLGYFPREAAPHPEPFTGERLTAAITGQVAIEHYHRYLFARAFCLGKDVLDVASGEGYGSAQLAQVARSVTALEYSPQTVRIARANFPRANLAFVNADARALPLGDASMDVVVSFETIEHFAGQEAFVAEVRRVLRPDGRFIVSTPDRDNYSPTGAPTNLHHVRELSRREFGELLSRHFAHVASLYQRPLLGSALIGDNASPIDPLVFERRGPYRLEACVGLPRPLYIIAVASNAPIEPLPDSLYIERSDLDTDALAARERSEELAKCRAEAIEAAERETTLRMARDLADRERAQWETRARDAERVAGSLRRFARHYLPRLWRHLFGR